MDRYGESARKQPVGSSIRYICRSPRSPESSSFPWCTAPGRLPRRRATSGSVNSEFSEVMLISKSPPATPLRDAHIPKSETFTPVLAKHSKSFSLIDCIAVGVDRMQRSFESMRKQGGWQGSELTDVTAKVLIYEAFVEGRLEAPKHLARAVDELYFEPKYEEFWSWTIWSLSNPFTSAFKELEPIPQVRATAKLGEFLETRFSHSF